MTSCGLLFLFTIILKAQSHRRLYTTVCVVLPVRSKIFRVWECPINQHPWLFIIDNNVTHLIEKSKKKPLFLSLFLAFN